MLLMKVLLAYSCGLIDRFRGDKVDVLYSKSVEATVYGLMVAAIMGFNLLEATLFAGLWLVGAAFGWGCPLGAYLADKPMKPEDLEWWQVGPLKKSVMFALIVRGVMWGLPVAAVGYLNPLAYAWPVAMGIIFPLALIITRYYNNIVNVPGWETQEFVRGWLVGIVALALSFA